MFGSVKGFEPVGNYAKEKVKNRKFQYGKDVQCSSDLLVAIIILEQAIQELAQLEDQWKEEHQASLKSFSQGEDMAWIQECEEMIMYHRNLGDWVGRILYHLEVRLPRGTLKNSYDKLREDPTWYLRKELVKDCVAKDGQLFELRDLMVENLNDPDPTYLLAMADAYFLPPETPGLKGNVVRMCKQIKKAFKIN
ncbi:uncharacterized protein N7473_006773 [Penicillium subrubescens]|uniref:Uncharacterized protein n=1 Tax=Penicillium subrubescens TaxID=1316194 RepID=A0A1Q5UQ60_9EURO|nr:uncharacterized protein N7473_006773 [Penicillium subrubescens]KAJ5890545.1 hypothetical protein N7473_006773 [Penicillium subrubescens]OKP14615.1 hypothetical protein PENSUB_13967 [Penicillium subrubescens]